MKSGMPRLNIVTIVISAVFAALFYISQNFEPQVTLLGFKAKLAMLGNISQSEQGEVSLDEVSPPNHENLKRSVAEPEKVAEPAPPKVQKINPSEAIPEKLAPLQGPKEKPIDPRGANESAINDSGAIIYFASDSSELTDSAIRVLKQVTRYLREHPNQWITIQGFADSLGDPATNRIFSQLRSKRVADRLRLYGVPMERRLSPSSVTVVRA